MNPLKRPRHSHHSDDAYDDGHPRPKRHALRSSDHSLATPSSHIPPLPRTHVVQAIQCMRGSLKKLGTPATSKRLADHNLANAEKVRALVFGEVWLLLTSISLQEMQKSKDTIEQASAVVSKCAADDPTETNHAMLVCR